MTLSTDTMFPSRKAVELSLKWDPDQHGEKVMFFVIFSESIFAYFFGTIYCLVAGCLTLDRILLEK